MLRILLFLGTNIAVMLLISVIFSVLGIGGLLQSNGVDLDLQALLIFSAVFGFAGSLISLFMSKTLAKRSMGVQLIEQPRNNTERWIRQTVERQAKDAGIGMPEVGVFQSDTPNAFATGWNKNESLVAVSTGLLQHMKQEEVEAVLGHEVSHIANGDMVTLTLIQGVVNTFVIFFSRVIGHFVDRVVFKVERGHGPAFWIVSIIAQLVLSVLASMIVAWFSRWREFRADAGGADLASRRAMINALRRLQQAQQANRAEPLPDAMAAFGIFGSSVRALFSSHPPLEVRIAALERRS
ncbi:MAG: protease HtpX [Thiotrichales bacterium]|nr:protease HtpX [Thiotrichales bacterium]